MESERETLKEELRNIVEEARMVLPGIQALFGFQTMAVFNDGFGRLPDSGVYAHLAAFALMAVAIAMIMTPAAYHRIAEPGCVSRRMIVLSSRLISTAMTFLAAGLTLDVYVVLTAAAVPSPLAIGGAAAMLVLFASMWFIFPALSRRRANGQAGSTK